MQKCIHGLSLAKETEGNLSTQSNNESETKIKDSASPPIKNPSKPISKKQKPEQHTTEANGDKGTINSSGSTTPRVKFVGIKNFTSNRILLNGQEEYFDKYHCVLIVPILDAENVKKLEG